LPDCPECVAKKKKAIFAKQAASVETEIPVESEMPVEGEFPMKFDISTKHFICKKCGLYATREQISDIDSIYENLLVKINNMTTWIGGKKVRKTNKRDRG
jgi:hypothetical protein